MTDYTILEIPTVFESSVKLTDVIYNCPVCDFEIEINMTVDNKSSINCENCDHLLKMKLKKV